jgi:hypothetical protein
MKLNCRIWLFLFLLNVSSIISGQNHYGLPVKRCPISTLNYETGLLNNTTNFILTDALGFTWLSTKIGLQRFNGNQLETINPVIGKDTFNINEPVYLFNLKNGLMWISFRNYLLEFNPFLNTFRIVTDAEPSNISGFSIVPLKETPEGIWCMQEKKAIVIYSPKGKIISQSAFYPTNITDGIIHSDELLLKKIIASNRNYIFMYEGNHQILKINTRTKKAGFIDCESSPSLSLSCTENHLFIVSNGKFLMLNINDSLVTKTISFNRITNAVINNNSIDLDNFGQLHVSMNNHLYELDTLGNLKSEITDLNRNPVVTTGFIDRIYTDKFKRIWLIDNDDVRRIQNVETPFVHFFYPDTKNNFVRTIYYDEEKHILLAGCFYTGLQLYDTLANPLWKEPLMTKDVRDILAIEKLSEDNYLIITYRNGWYILSIHDKKIWPFIFPAAYQSLLRPALTKFTNNIQRLNNTTLLVATANNIITCVFDKTTLKSAVALLPANSDFQNQVNCFLYDERGFLWIGSAAGIVYRLDKNQNIEKFPIPGNYIVRTLAEDAKHTIWAGTDKGLYAFSKEGKLIKKISASSGLLNDCIYSLLPVKNGSAVFAATNLGLSFISSGEVLKNYSKELGLQNLEFNTASCTQSKSGKLYFGGVDGITSFYPDALSVIKDTPGLYITRMVINDIPNNFSSHIQKGDSILLNYSQNHLQLDIAAIGLLNPDEYIYKYRLKGFQNIWQLTHQPNNINYILPPGKYVLEIICSANLSTNIFFKKNISIIISPPWWQTLWFITLAVIFLVTILFLIVHSYNRNKYNQKLKILQNKYEMQQERERVSRDLHDNLGAQANALLYGIEQLQNSDSTNPGLVKNLYTTAKDMMLSLRETIWVMKHNDATASEIWFRIINFRKQLSVFYKDIKISTDGELPENFEFKTEEALHIVLIVQESLNNAVRHSDAKNITAESSVQNNVWTIKVKDDGKGIKKDNNHDGSGGFGLNNMQERASIAKLNLTIESDEGRGTCITLLIPLNKKNV